MYGNMLWQNPLRLCRGCRPECSEGAFPDDIMTNHKLRYDTGLFGHLFKLAIVGADHRSTKGCSIFGVLGDMKPDCI